MLIHTDLTHPEDTHIYLHVYKYVGTHLQKHAYIYIYIYIFGLAGNKWDGVKMYKYEKKKKIHGLQWMILFFV